MRNIKLIVLSGVLALCPNLYGQDDGFFTGITRWGSKPIEPGSSDTLKQLTTELAEVKSRIKLLEENQNTFSAATKSQLQTLNDSLKSMQSHCEKLQQESTSYKSGLTQAGAVVPVAKQPADDATAATKAAQEQMNKRFDELAAAMDNFTKLNLQVQANTRDTADLKKKVDAQDKRLEIHDRDIIQAQSDIGKLQQDFAKSNTDRPRQSLALPLPPESQATTPVRSNLSTVKLVNSYLTPVTIIVDGQLYTLRSNDSLSLTKSPGYFTYEVPGIQANTLRNLGVAETMTIQIVPR